MVRRMTISLTLISVLAVCGREKSTTPEPLELTMLGTFDYSRYIHEIFVQDQYIYLAADNSGMAIIDAVEPELPSLAIFYHTPSTVSDIFISGDYAYLACGSADLIILDISDPYNPVCIGNYPPPESPNLFARAVYVEGSYLYLGAGGGSLQILNISNPSQPALIGSISNLQGIYEISISGTNAYLLSTGDIENSFLDIIDITYPFNPEILGRCSFYWWSQHITIVNEYAYLTLPSNRNVNIYSVADPQNPSQVTEIETPGTAVDVFASGSYAYVADGDSGLQIIDIFLPPDPFIAASYDISGYASLVFQENEYIYLVNRDTGLMIFRYAASIR